MKVTFIASSLSSGGAERVMSILANDLSKGGHQVKIIKFNKALPHYRLSEDVELVTLATAGLKNRIFRYLGGVYSLKKELEKERKNSDVFISFLSECNILSILLKPRNVPLIISERNQEARVRSKFWRFLRKKTYPYADALTVLFPEDAEYYKKFMQNVEVMPNPSPFESSDTPFEKEKLVILVARLHHTKNISMFLRAVSMLDDDLRCSHKFCVLGKGNLKASLEEEAGKLGIQVSFLGAVDNVQEYYRRAKIICLSSDVEGLPMTLIEPLFFEVARISTKSSDGILTLIENEVDGFLVEKGDARAMSEKMALLMRDEKLRQEIVQRANRKREMFDVKHITKKWINLIGKIDGYAQKN